MRMRAGRWIAVMLGAGVLAGCSAFGVSSKDVGPEALEPTPGESPAPPAPDPWPRQLQLADAQVTVYPPQVETWRGNQLVFRCAVDVLPGGANDERFGVIWGAARTQVDRVQRAVGLADLQLTHGNFPALPDRGASLFEQLRGQLPQLLQTLALDRLEASLAAAGDLAPGRVSVRNAPPVIFVSYAPAVLIPIDGRPVWRRIPDTSFERVLNTRAAILREVGSNRVYLHVYDGWLTAGSTLGPWSLATSEPPGIGLVAADLAQQRQLDLLDGGNVQPRPTLASGAPAIYVSQKPAELIVFKGQPSLQPIGATSLLWAANTTADVIVDKDDGAWYVLLAGRWYSAPSLFGPWSFIASTKLPSAFSEIPPGSPAGPVLASIAGTAQAREALIENSIPQTASVALVNGPRYAPRYDGLPTLAAIPGTPLQYVLNSPTPTIRVDAHAWYALRAGVWFVAASIDGPFQIATLVPAAIYTIPVASPLHYVTYVQVYGSSADAIHVGYTPGYLGTLAAPDGVVVYGAGYEPAPWIGTVYYAPPPTWGLMAQPVVNAAVGRSYGFALGLTTAAMLDGWGALVYYTSAYHRQPCCGSAGVDVYEVWGDAVSSGTRTQPARRQGDGWGDHFGGGGFGDRFGEGGAVGGVGAAGRQR